MYKVNKRNENKIPWTQCYWRPPGCPGFWPQPTQELSPTPTNPKTFSKKWLHYNRWSFNKVTIRNTRLSCSKSGHGFAQPPGLNLVGLLYEEVEHRVHFANADALRKATRKAREESPGAAADGLINSMKRWCASVSKINNGYAIKC